MTPRLPALKPKQVIKALSKAGFFVDHQAGSHVIITRMITGIMDNSQSIFWGELFHAD